jgi:DNA-nicking Smr family endonuclease
MKPALPETAELELFRSETQDTRPLTQDRIEPWKRKIPPRPLDHPELEEQASARDLLSAGEVETHELLEFFRPGLQQRVFHDLRRGHIEVELELDLHGYRAEEARQILELCFKDCRQQHVRCLRIIHGKGYGSAEQQPVLKQLVNVWLRQREDVLAFCSATRRDGGAGAVYVLLRSAQKQQRRSTDGARPARRR